MVRRTKIAQKHMTNLGTKMPDNSVNNRDVAQTEARGFALYVGIDEHTAAAAGTSLTQIVAALRATLKGLVEGSSNETFAAVALAPTAAGGRNLDVVRTALHDPRAIDQLTAAQVQNKSEAGIVVDLERRKVLADGTNAGLTQREFELINYLIAHKGETISRRELIDSVWADDPETAPNDRTIDVHVRRLRSKISGYEDIIRTIRGGGYRFDSHPDVHVGTYDI
jgi:DNA-binding response OmpR family regulator